MPKSRKDPSRSKNLNQFKNQSKKMNLQATTGKQFLVPETSWESNEELILPGHVLEAIEKNFVEQHKALAEAQAAFDKQARILQVVFQKNIAVNKIKLQYKWNNGEVATTEEVEQFKADMAKVREHQQKQFEAQQAAAAPKSGLVTANGQDIPSSLSQEDDSTNATDALANEILSSE
jgi:hypothetical protein